MEVHQRQLQMDEVSRLTDLQDGVAVVAATGTPELTELVGPDAPHVPLRPAPEGTGPTRGAKPRDLVGPRPPLR